MLEVKFKLNHPEAKKPVYAYDTDACMDLFAADILITEKYIEYNTGINMLIPLDYVGLLFSRSSVTNKNLIQKNSVGIIDHGYIGDIKIRFYNLNNINDIYSIGDRVGQIMIIERPKIKLIETEYFEETKRNINGYGSTGK